MPRAELFVHPHVPFLMMKFPARRESVFELRFPEHWGSPSLKAKYGDKTRVHAVANTIRWETPDVHHASAAWEPDASAPPYDREWRYRLDYEGHADFVDIRMQLAYSGAKPWDGENILACLRNRMAHPFIDPEGVRTYLYRRDGPVTVNEIISGRFKWHRMMSVRVARRSSLRKLAHPLMATFSADRKYALAFAFARGIRCSGNFGLNHCIHSNPGVSGMKPGETRLFRGRIYCIPARRPEEVLDRWLADAPELVNP